MENSNNNNLSVGVILARFQPIHNGHLELIKTAIKENDKVLIIIGSADKIGERNPIPSNIRYNLVSEAVNALPSKDAEKCSITLLDDLSSEEDNSHDWGFYLYANIVKFINQPNFTIYYSDGFEIITKWFPGYILRNFVSLKLIARNSIHNGVSATQVRNAILNKNYDSIKNLVPKNVFDFIPNIYIYLSIWNYR